jgi:predicted dehydrogenase
VASADSKTKQMLSEGGLGPAYRACIRIASAFPVFDNQPALRTLDQFLLMDMGSHILDVERFPFGEPVSLRCTTAQVQAGIRGEEVATVVLTISSDAAVICEMAYAEPLWSTTGSHRHSHLSSAKKARSMLEAV